MATMTARTSTRMRLAPNPYAKNLLKLDSVVLIQPSMGAAKRFTVGVTLSIASYSALLAFQRLSGTGAFLLLGPSVSVGRGHVLAGWIALPVFEDDVKLLSHTRPLRPSETAAISYMLQPHLVL